MNIIFFLNTTELIILGNYNKYKENLIPLKIGAITTKEKDKYILTHIYGIQKNGTEEFIYRAAMQKQT